MLRSQHVRIIFISAVIIFSSQSRLFGQELKRERSFSTLRLNYDDVVEILSTVNSYLAEINILDSSEYVEYFVFKSDDQEYKYEKFYEFDNIEFKENSNEFLYYYSNEEGTINKVTIDFSRYKRQVLISGRNHEYVNGLFKNLEEKIQRNRTFINYTNLDILWIFLIVVLPFTMTFISKQLLDRYKINGYVTFLVAIAILIIFLIGFLKGSALRRYLFPNFIVYAGEKSFISRNADLFEFIGFIALLITFLISSYKWLRKNEQALSKSNIQVQEKRVFKDDISEKKRKKKKKKK